MDARPMTPEQVDFRREHGFVRVEAVETPWPIPFLIPNAEGGLYHGSEGDDWSVYNISRTLFDAIPNVALKIDDLPTSDSTEDDEELCRRYVGSEYDWWFGTSEIYFGMGALSGLVKIGISKDRYMREVGYRAMSAEEIEFQYMPGNKTLERLLKTRFRPIRHHGEWFYPHAALLSYMWSAIR